MAGFFALCVITAGYALVAKRLSCTISTAPMVFLVLGVAFSLCGLITPETGEALLYPVAGVALVILLFLDAARTDVAALRRRFVWPVRMLVIVRPLAIWTSLVGTNAPPVIKLFFGWFGPRGLATALFALLVVENLPHALDENMLHLAINAMWISAILHGMTAAPGARWYGAVTERMALCAETSHNISTSKEPT